MTCCTPAAGGGIEPGTLPIGGGTPPQRPMSLPGVFIQSFATSAIPPSTISNPVNVTNPSPTPRAFVDQFIDTPVFIGAQSVAIRNVVTTPTTGNSGSSGTPYGWTVIDWQ